MKDLRPALLLLASLLSSGCTTYIHGPLERRNLEKAGFWPGPQLTIQETVVEERRPQGFLSREIDLTLGTHDGSPCELPEERTVEFLHSSNPTSGVLGFTTLSLFPIAYFFPVWENSSVDSLLIVRDRERIVFAKRYGSTLRTWYGLWAHFPGNRDNLLTDNPSTPHLQELGQRLVRRLAADLPIEMDLYNALCQENDSRSTAVENSAE